MHDLDTALDLLDWMPGEAVREIRDHIARAQRARSGTAAAGERREWTAVEVAVIYVLWMTSNESLTEQMQEPSAH